MFDDVLLSLKELSGDPYEVQSILCSQPSKGRPHLEAVYDVDLDDFFWNDVLPMIDSTKIRKLGVSKFVTMNSVFRLPKTFPGLVMLQVDIFDLDLMTWDETTETRRKFLNVSQNSR